MAADSNERLAQREAGRLIVLARDMLTSPSEEIVVAYLDLAMTALQDLGVPSSVGFCPNDAHGT
ncbi:hypothetical protein [Sphingopyxis sp. YR583]|uniref:hypothetical protein n=1 Tax=Sphingopyxis sp. YR583 TaxID=1881047 RepID=UPI00115FCBBC|nr:hypothetical protein [Sphingopyxis sp. YR583]